MSTQEPTTLALVFGGRSGEHSVSCMTAAGILGALDRDRYRIVPIGVTHDGRWTLVSDDSRDWALEEGALPVVPNDGPRVVLPGSAGSREFSVVDPDGSLRHLADVDVVFPILHGPYGEDGTVQGALELIDMPYVGAGVLASAVGMDKHYAKVVFESAGLPVGPYEVVTSRDWDYDHEASLRRIRALDFPVFVKPARAGSSLGIRKVSDFDDLESAIAGARKHDAKIIVESQLEGREVECAVLGGRGGEPARASVPGEIEVVGAGHDFYDFEAKYLDDTGLRLQCPATLPEDVSRELRDLAIRAFDAIGAEGLSRVDFFYDPGAAAGSTLVINEINTMPGFTASSMYPRAWQATGLSYPDLLAELIELALERPVGLR